MWAHSLMLTTLGVLPVVNQYVIASMNILIQIDVLSNVRVITKRHPSTNVGARADDGILPKAGTRGDDHIRCNACKPEPGFVLMQL